MILSNKNHLNKDEYAQLLHWKCFAYLNTFVSRFGNIKPRKYTNTTLKQQKILRKHIIRARELGLLMYIR